MRFLIKVGGNTRGPQVAHIEGLNKTPLCGQRIAREQWQLYVGSKVSISVCSQCQRRWHHGYEIAVEKFRR